MKLSPEERVAKRMDKGESSHSATKKVAKSKRQKKGLRLTVEEDFTCGN